MSSAPVLNGVAGSLVALLDAVLVNGFGSTGVTSIVIVDGIATMTFPGTHPFIVDSVCQNSGATPSGLNGQHRILSISANTATFATSLSNQTATGTISTKVAAAGWVKSFSFTNGAVYRSASPEASGCYLRVDDTTTTSARVRGFETMTDSSTGQGPFPTDSQLSGGSWFSKSWEANSTARPWHVIADDLGFYFLPEPYNTSYAAQGAYFGDIKSYKSNDPYACILRAGHSNLAQSAPSADDLGYSDGTANANSGAYAARAPNSLGGSQPVSLCLPFPATSNNYFLGVGGYPYPASVNNGLFLGSLQVYSGSLGLRGLMPGCYSAAQSLGGFFGTGDRVDGSDDYAGMNFYAIKMGLQTAGGGIIFFNLRGDWR